MNIKYIVIGIILGTFIGLSLLVSAQEVASKDHIHDIELVRRARGESSKSGGAATSTGDSSAKSTATTNTHGGGGDTSTFASPAILENGTLFYISISVTCLLWVTGKTIDVLTDRLDKHAETTIHKI